MRNILYVFLLLLIISHSPSAQACSMSKVTRNGVTIVGNNEDSWRLTPLIWFEPATEKSLGCCFVGNDDYWPQGGMNTAGLVYDAFTMYPSAPPSNGKTKPEPLGDFLRGILYTCKTVQEVYAYADQFDRSGFDRAMMMFVDSTGAFLVMEADTMIIGSDPDIVLTNFSYARRKDPNMHFQDRYFRGVEFLKQSGSGFAYSRDLMQAMSECRARKGDGTTYTSLYNVHTREMELYFYHAYTDVAKFQLDAELAKGAHTIKMEEIFPQNPEFVTLKNYVTPVTHMWVLPYMLAMLTILMLLAAGLMTQWFRQLHLADRKLQYFRLAFAVVNILLGIYIMILMMEKSPYYFPAPYQEDGRGWINVLSYLPYVIVLLLFTGVFLLARKHVPVRTAGRWFYGVIMLLWCVCCLAFAYWGFYAF